MSILTAARQYALVAIANFTQAELPTGVAVDVLELPPGAVVTKVAVVIDTAFDSVTSDTIDVGDASVADRYDSTVDAQAAGQNDGVPTGFETTSSEPNIQLTNTQVGGEGSAGAGRLIVEYVVAGRHNENQGDGVEFAGSPA